MAITSWIGGSFAGKVGGYVGSNWKGIKTMRSTRNPQKKAPDPTEKQLSVQSKFSMVTAIASSVNDSWLKKYWRNVKKMTPYNYFVKACKEAMSADSVDPAKVIFPQNYLGAPISPTAAPTISGATVSVAVPAAAELSLGTPTEYVVVAYSPAINVAVSKVVAAAETTVTLTLPQTPESGETIYVYLQAGNGEKVNFSSVSTISVA